MDKEIDETAIGEHYAKWFMSGLRGIGMRYIFSRRGLWVINTPFWRILRTAEIAAEDRVLDLGCGIGNLLIALAQRTAFTHPAIGVDVSPGLIEIGRQEIKRAHLEGRIELRVAAATSLPFADASFDVVFTSHVIKHLDDAKVRLAFAEVHRVLRPGGRFLVWEFKKSPFSAPLFLSARASGLPPAFKLRDAPALATALLGAGFQRVDRVPAGFFLMPPVPRIAMLATR